MPRKYTLSDFQYELPPELIAQAPLAERDASRLMVVERSTGKITHANFRDLATLVAAGDVLVRNTTAVFPARLLGRRDSGAPAEVFLLKSLGNDRWEAMVQPGDKLRPGRHVNFAPGFDAEVLETTPQRTRIVRLIADDVARAIDAHGHIPLPPYIARADSADDASRYQTVYASERGSVAAPTAGLHFTPAVLDAIAARGATFADVLLHVGAGTFKPVRTERLDDHVMHREWCVVSEDAAARVNAARDAGRAVWAIGTTSLRTLESAMGTGTRVSPTSGETDLFIRPPTTIRSVDRLVTNFHLPGSTLLMLICAFAGYDLAMRAYAEAIRERYRFYSYGDAMVIL
ncbi:MAG: tRNA preQ1(34) S-adenosylmethionine ribosyltransferase-isomerase QueA [Gemmatimonadetes bacterium]|nr:tRNA preQ1(34) S-adenosylmethionine ribosyltransferase-isomerase QueA [Gemmatimonadota bacterium]